MYLKQKLILIIYNHIFSVQIQLFYSYSKTFFKKNTKGNFFFKCYLKITENIKN